MHKATGFILVCAALTGGYIGGRSLRKTGQTGDAVDNAPSTVKAVAAPGTVAQQPPGAQPPRGQCPAVPPEVYKVEIGQAPTKGGKQPKVTIVEFSEFQCPFCSRVGPTLKQVSDTYKNDVQIAFKHLPLDFHPNAMPAALAAEAAREQGEFWEMHDKLFANQQALDQGSFDKYAGELGLNLAKFKAAADGKAAKDAIAADKQYAGKFGVTGTPSFFINGRKFRGAQPLECFKAIIDEELKKADQKLAAGTARPNLYAAIIKDGLDAPAPAPAPTPSPAAPGATTIAKVDIAGAPVKGAKDALITIVEFSDFQCPFCSRVEPTMDKVMETYKGKVRVVWRDYPLPFHNNALPAAVAARAAGAQGKFWEMHKKLFDNQQALDGPSLEKYAQDIGLNMGRFKADITGDKLKKAAEADMAMGSKVGVNGTPGFFINGVNLSGAQPYEAFKPIIDAELAKAESLVKSGTPKAKVYEAIMKAAKDAPPPAPAQAQGAPPAGPESDPTVFKVDPGKSPAKGPKTAAITMVVFSDFQCPYCSRVEPSISQVEKEYPGKVRVVWKNYPLPFHENAKPAALAAMAAGEQGKFWEMHDKLFENQKALDGASLEKYAGELGLNLAKFKTAMTNPANAATIDADMKEGTAVGVNGTPATFVNGRKIGGAYPYETFKKVVEQELAKTGKGKKS